MSFGTKAIRSQKRLRMAGDGPPGSGKTYTFLRFAHVIADMIGSKKRIAVIDSENGSASCYVGEKPDGIPFAFDIETLTDYSPQNYTTKIKLAGQEGYDCLLIDGLTHAWAGEGGALDIQTDITQKSNSKNSYYAWRTVTPMHNAMIEAILRSPCHVFATLRTKIEYAEVKTTEGGTSKTKYERIGARPIQREGLEYEFDIFGDFYQDEIVNGVFTIAKSRCRALPRNSKAHQPGRDFIVPVVEWLQEGAPLTTDDTPLLTLFDRYYQRLILAKSQEEVGIIGREVKAGESLLKPAEMEALRVKADEMKSDLPATVIVKAASPGGNLQKAADALAAGAPAAEVVKFATTPPTTVITAADLTAAANGKTVEGESLYFAMMREKVTAAATVEDISAAGREASALASQGKFAAGEFDKIKALGKKRKEDIVAAASKSAAAAG